MHKDENGRVIIAPRNFLTGGKRTGKTKNSYFKELGYVTIGKHYIYYIYLFIFYYYYCHQINNDYIIFILILLFIRVFFLSLVNSKILIKKIKISQYRYIYCKN